jgi:hypothetical protein
LVGVIVNSRCKKEEKESMAGFHPFRTFQRNQKAWLVGIGVGTMISFIILPAFLQMIGRGGSTLDTIAECRSFGRVTNQTVAILNEDRETYRRFLYVLYETLAEPGNETKMNSLRPLVSYISRFEQRQNTEQHVNEWILARYAQQQGLTVDRADVVSLLKQLTAGYISDAIFQDTLKSVGISQQRFHYLAEQDLLRQRLVEQFNLSISAVSPATRWDWYQRLNRQTTAEVVAVPVEQFFDQVKTPNDHQLKSFFEARKATPYNPGSPESGFAMPNKIAFQYAVASPDKKMLDSITEDEMRKFYEENKDSLFRKPTQPVGERPTLPGMPGGLSGTSSVPFPTPGIVPTPTAPATPAPVEQPAEQPKAEEPKKEGSSLPSKAVTRFVSYQNEAPEAAESGATPAPAEQPKVEEPKPAEQPKAEEPKKEEPKAEEKKEEPKPVEQPKPSETLVDLSILYRPFDEVKDQIRETLARQKAEEMIPLIEEKMRDYAREYNLNFEQGKTVPPLPDLTSFVAEKGLEFKTIPLGMIFDSIRSEFAARGFREREQLIRLYTESPMKFEPAKFSGTDGMILLWVTDLQAEYKPDKFEEVKDEVLKRWKEVEARPLALKRAEELLEEAKKSQKSLAETFAGQSGVSVVETEPFTWKTYGAGIHPIAAIMQGQRPFIDEVREKGVAVGDSEIGNKQIFAPGADFMAKVLSLGVGEIGAVFNQPQSIAFVVRVTGSSPSEDVLWERFQTAYMMEYLFAGQPEVSSEAYQAWISKIYNETGFKWVNKPAE